MTASPPTSPGPLDLDAAERDTRGFRGIFAWSPEHERDGEPFHEALMYVPEDVDLADDDECHIISDTIEQHVAEPIARILNRQPTLLAELRAARGTLEVQSALIGRVREALIAEPDESTVVAATNAVRELHAVLAQRDEARIVALEREAALVSALDEAADIAARGERANLSHIDRWRALTRPGAASVVVEGRSAIVDEIGDVVGSRPVLLDGAGEVVATGPIAWDDDEPLTNPAPAGALETE